MAALAAANHLTDPNLIFVGQLLAVGAGAPHPVAPSWGVAAGTTYTVVAGDTLGSIAARFGTSVAALTAANHLSDPNLIFVGQVLAVGHGAPRPRARPRRLSVVAAGTPSSPVTPSGPSPPASGPAWPRSPRPTT